MLFPNFNCASCIGHLLVILQLIKNTTSFSAKITLENGVYNGITVGIHEDISANDCQPLITNLTSLLTIFSTRLFEATEGLASIGTVSVLVPDKCSLNSKDILVPKPSFTYKSTHVQITSTDPFTDFLPNTAQYRPCGQPSDRITLPASFFEPKRNLNDNVKAKMLLHEWSKFRYGVFDEFGYEDDAHFPPCYKFDKQAHITGCTDSSLISAVALNDSVCSFDFLNKYKVKIHEQLSNGTSSLLSSPHISTVTKFCDKSTHNKWSVTKQNVYCDKKSVSEVIFSHYDFQGSDSKVTAVRTPPPPTLKIYKHGRTYDAGYVFIIEDSANMRSTFKIQHVKQAIAQFLQILTNTEVMVVVYSENGACQTRNKLVNDDQKRDILKRIPDINSRDSCTPTQPFNNISSITDFVISNVVSEDSSNYGSSFSWSVVYFTSGRDTEEDIQSAVASVEQSSLPVTIFTFENQDPKWLLWYGIPNTGNVISLPFCTLPDPPSGPCHFEPSRLILTELVGILNRNQLVGASTNRFIQSPVEPVYIPSGGNSAYFNIPGNGLTIIDRLFLFVEIPSLYNDPMSYINVFAPNNVEQCTVSYVLSYERVLIANCPVIPGLYKVSLNLMPPPGTPRLHMSVFGEGLSVSTENNKLAVTPSLGIMNQTSSISPNSRSRIPLFVTVKTLNGYPVLHAGVSVKVIDASQKDKSELVSTTVQLYDDGESNNGADQTGNDGTYSGYLTGYSKTNGAYHVAKIRVETKPESEAMTKAGATNRAILLDDLLSLKCCGKMITPQTTVQLEGNVVVESLHIGFKTNEPQRVSYKQPGTVSSIRVLDESETSISIEFLAVKGDIAESGQGTSLLGYQACCVSSSAADVAPGDTPNDSTCKENTVDCGAIQDYGANQTCSLNKNTLLKSWVRKEDWTSVGRLKCGIRAVSTDYEYGGVSHTLFDVDLDAVIEEAKANSQSCEKFSISDKCLPIWIFWVVIGCLGLLVLIILIISICWCVSCRRQKPNEKKAQAKENVLAVHYTTPPPPARSSTDSSSEEESSSKVVKELFVNHAYIQDGDGEIKIIADNGQIMRKPKPEAPSRINTFTPQFHNPQPPRVTTTTAAPPPQENMQVFKPVPMPKTNANLVKRPPSRLKLHGERARPEIFHPNPQLKSDSSFSTTPRTAFTPSPTKSPTEPSVVYASINAARLRTPTSPPGKQVSFDPHYMVPHNTVHNRKPNNNNIGTHSSEPRFSPSPPHLPQYPTYTETDSSSSEYYEDRYNAQQQRPKRNPPRFNKPPPYPAGSRIVQQQQASNPAVWTTKPTKPPPVPPPRFVDRSANLSQGKGILTAPIVRPASTPPTPYTSKQEMIYIDDDSDQWDDGDGNYELDVPTGASYA